ncbi:MAG: hypothetical protein EA399_08690 [Desulfovibrionales bacterium]|nr:MAG: hypothetical protein EA399_08690 [Desulfovibrionales bacterium]
MTEQSRIWRDIGLKYLFQPCEIIPAQHQSGAKTSEIFPNNIPEQLVFYWHKIQKPISIIVTYQALDQDFRGLVHIQRFQLLHSILRATPWPVSDVAFWPTVLHDKTVATEESTMMMQALIIELQPRFLLDFGGSLGHLITSTGQRHEHMEITCREFQHVILPALEDMLPDNKRIKKQAWDILRNLSA